jgi:PAS domain S-box-containing protein
VEIVRPDGTKRWGVVRGEALRDESGCIVGLRGTVQDVHERRRAEELLRESEQRLRLAAQAGRVYATEWDRASGVITRSEEFTRILGLSADQQKTNGDDIMATVHPEDREKISAAAYGTTPQAPSYRVQYRVVRPDGALVWLEASGLALFDRTGTMYRTIGMVADITEHKRAEEAISALSRRLIDAQENERARIARDLHDDIGQRLALALVTLEQQKPDTVKKELRKQLEDIAKSVHSLSHELHAATLRYLGIAKAMRGFCVELAEQKQVEIVFSHHNVPRTVPREISLCLFRVLQEALHNAVRYSKVSRFEVELVGSSDAVSLVVRDGGVGFDPEKAMNGRGLGLISMQERLKLVSGRLSVESQRLRGTAIHATVPLADPSLRAVHPDE